MNVCSLTKNFDDFNILFNQLNVSFDIVVITESQLRKIHQSLFSEEKNDFNLNLKICEKSSRHQVK